MKECTCSPSGMMSFYIVTWGCNFTSAYLRITFSLSLENEQADVGQDGRTNGSRETKLSGANGDKQ